MNFALTSSELMNYNEHTEKVPNFWKEVHTMTEMKRVTISIPDELDRKVIELRKTDERFERCSYSEIVRQMLELGMMQHRVECEG